MNITMGVLASYTFTNDSDGYTWLTHYHDKKSKPCAVDIESHDMDDVVRAIEKHEKECWAR